MRDKELLIMFTKLTVLERLVFNNIDGHYVVTRYKLFGITFAKVIIKYGME